MSDRGLPKYKIVPSENGLNGVTVERDDKKGSVYLIGETNQYIENLEAENKALRDKLESAMQATQFYANQTSYSASWVVGQQDPKHVMEDKGRVAKNALSKILDN